MQIIGKLREKKAQKVATKLASLLYDGEELLFLSDLNSIRPSCDGLAITNARVLAFLAYDVNRDRVGVSVWGDEISGVEVQKGLSGKYVCVKREGESLRLGVVAEPERVTAEIENLCAAGVPSEVQEAREAKKAQDAEETAAQVALAAEEKAAKEELAPEAYYRDINLSGKRPSARAHRVLLENAKSDEKPWFVLGAGMNGVLAAFEDRLYIIKTGGLTSFMASSFGGGRVTAFYYDQITGIEYNSGIINGVLEVLTPSYQGTNNHDFWNLDKNTDPYKLSNALPLDKTSYKAALPQLSELREKVTNFRRGLAQPQVEKQVSSGGLVAELKELAELKAQGVLSEDEFVAAKAAAIAKHGS